MTSLFRNVVNVTNCNGHLMTINRKNIQNYSMAIVELIFMKVVPFDTKLLKVKQCQIDPQSELELLLGNLDLSS